MANITSDECCQDENDPFFSNEESKRCKKCSLIRIICRWFKKKKKKKIKLLLIGGNNSGKSTELKQVKLLHQGAFTAREWRRHS